MRKYFLNDHPTDLLDEAAPRRKSPPPATSAINFNRIVILHSVLRQKFDCIVIEAATFTLTLQSGGYNEHQITKQSTIQEELYKTSQAFKIGRIPAQNQ